MLIANRGEIARRIIATCRGLGIESVAVCSDADASAPFVREADLAVGLPGEAAADTYLRGDLIVAAARQAGADAVHPGYGFLSENAGFARAVMDAGLTWIGPEPDSIAAMGSKVRAKELMRAAGVPVLGDEGELDASDYPVLVKASAGGGGRGMRIVREPAELESALAAAWAEAESAFGDPTVFVEPYLDQARHIEVQVLADRHGTCWILGERDCSIQRRHQKIIEETPAPGITDELRAALHRAAADSAKAIGYVGAGTVEFLVTVDPADGSGRLYFLEMNTRLQVEHPVTECVTGLDLVAWQLRIAEGARLAPEPPTPQRHAIEVRLYAEDPTDDWRPQTGLIRALDVPDVDTRFGPPVGMGHGLRLDSGVEAGDSIGVHYDPMLAKLIAWAPTRAEATRRLASGLRRARIHGVTTNRDLLVRILTDSEFAAGGVHTGLLAERLAEWSPPLLDQDQRARAAVAAALAQATAAQAAARVQSRIPSGWRALASQPRRVRFGAGDTDVAVAYSTDRDRFVVHEPTGVVVHDVGPDRVTLTHEGVRETYSVASYPDGVVDVDGPHGSVTLTRRPRFADPADQGTTPGSLLAPMPGVVARIHVEPGEQVAAGAPVMTLEAMKMQHEIRAPIDGVVAEISTRQGAQVDSGTILAVVDPDPDNSAVAQEDPT
ncbi:MAG TPA: biotin carboxylase N-terminal domain-containing protein [Nocardioidaceae bacterium]|nr:biotin carboxylase N-terminal domain-containing protein [Nocardioidaceae bacterium]